MRLPRIPLILALCFLTACSTPSTSPAENPEQDIDSAGEEEAVALQGDVETVPVGDEDLEGIWIRVITALPDPDKSGHFWLQLDPDGTFKVTENKMAFDDEVAHQGTFVFEDEVFTFTAEEGSMLCEGQTASYKAIKLAEGPLVFITVDAPCEEWLSMGQGKLGEGTLWVRPNE
jgi:hypothetical protein